MDLGVLEGQTRGDYFLNSIFDPSVNQCTVHALWRGWLPTAGAGRQIWTEPNAIHRPKQDGRSSLQSTGCPTTLDT